MTRPALVRLALRALAIAIAVAALVDPVVVRGRRDRPVVAVTAVPDGDGDAALAARVRARLARAFAVVEGPYLGADAMVAIGGVPRLAREVRVPAFVVTPGTAGPALGIEAVQVPRAASPGGLATVRAVVRARGARGRFLAVSLQADGIPVADTTRVVANDDERVEVSLIAPVPAAGPASVQVAASIDGTAASQVASAVIPVSERRWSILVHDARPSWMSTFVRRALERDSRFEVASRIEMSPSFAVATPGAARLADAPALDRYDAIVVGAAEALSARDVGALDAFMRTRGGSVVLLLDDSARGPVVRLGGTSAWRSRAGNVLPLGAAPTSGTPVLRAAEFAWPSVLPVGAAPIVSAPANAPPGDGGGAPAASPDGSAHPVVWSSPVGAGHLVVSGAFDAWRYRDARQSQFDRFWQGVVASEAARAWPRIVVGVTPAVAKPGEMLRVEVVVRSAALDDVTRAGSRSFTTALSASATLGGVPLDLLPDGATGHLVAYARAPSPGPAAVTGAVPPGLVAVVARAGADEATTPVFIAPHVVRPRASNADLLEAWARSRGGRVFGEGDLDALAGALLTAVHPAARNEPWHPFRSPWWVVPFALLLSAEWYLRRRRSLP